MSVKKRAIDALVREALKNNTNARENDMTLFLEVWELQGFHTSKDQRLIFMNCLAPEVITRARKTIQEQGFYRPEISFYQHRLLQEKETKNE